MPNIYFRRFVASFLTTAIIQLPVQALSQVSLFPISVVAVPGESFTAQALASTSVVSIVALSHGKVSALQEFPDNPMIGFGGLGPHHHNSGGKEAMERWVLERLSSMFGLVEGTVRERILGVLKNDRGQFESFIESTFIAFQDKPLTRESFEPFADTISIAKLRVVMHTWLHPPLGRKTIAEPAVPVYSWMISKPTLETNDPELMLNTAVQRSNHHSEGAEWALATIRRITEMLNANPTAVSAVDRSRLERMREAAYRLLTPTPGYSAAQLHIHLNRYDVGEKLPPLEHKKSDNIVNVLESHMRRLILLAPHQRSSILESYQKYIASLRGNADPRLLSTWEQWTKRNATPSFTSFPAEELQAVWFIQIFDPSLLSQETQRVLEETPSLTEEYTTEEVLGPARLSIERILKAVPVREDERDQISNELLLIFYSELLHRHGIKLTPKRMVEICLNTSRDGQQSKIGARLSGAIQRIIIRLQAVLGIRIMETWGGLVNQTTAWKKVRNDAPEDMWHNLRQQTLILREEFLAVMHEYDPAIPGENKISKKDWDQLFDRYEFKEDRKLLSDEDVAKIVDRYTFLQPVREKIIRQYGLKQEMLLRGQYLVGLKSYPLEVQKLFVRVAYQNGMDVFRIFDAENDVRNILPLIEAAKAVGARVQPVLHYTTDFPLGLKEYVHIADTLVAACGNSLDTLVLKDAGGLLDSDASFDHIRALRIHFNALGQRVPFQLHTHDTRGNRLLTLLEAIRANGDQDPITVDLGAGKNFLSGEVGQPDVRDFLNMTDGTSWATAYPIDREKLAELEYKIEHEIMTDNGMPRFILPNLASAVRRLLVEVARIPGGAFTSFYAVFLHGLSLCASTLNRRYEINLDQMSSTVFSSTGKRFVDGLLVAVLSITRAVTTDLGEVSLVTPTAHWIYSQASINLSHWVKEGWAIITRKGEGDDVSLTFESVLSGAAPSDRGLQYRMTPEIQNYLLIWSQDAERQRLYPKVNRDVVLQAYRMLNDFDVNLEWVKTALASKRVSIPKIKRALGKYEGLRQVTGSRKLELAEKPFVDLAIVSLKKRWYSSHESAPTRDDLISILDGENIPQTTDELLKSYAKIQAQFPLAATDSKEDFLTWVVFPEADNSIHLFGHVQKKREAAIKEDRILFERTGRTLIPHSSKVSA